MQQTNKLGIDIGSVSISLVEMSQKGKILHMDYRYHSGRIDDTLRNMLSGYHDTDIPPLVCTGAARPFINSSLSYDSRICLVEGARLFYPEADAILDVGAEKFCLYFFNNDGTFRGLSSSTSCAAGTGGFLDQQARRLSLADSAELSSLAAQNSGSIPKIASRCAVFAKTDIIHAQQEGYSIEQICDGLCEGLARTITGTLFKGEAKAHRVGFTGGVSRNHRVLHYVALQTGAEITAHPLSHCASAAGACLLALRSGSPAPAIAPEEVHPDRDSSDNAPRYFYAPLELKLSEYPDFNSHSTTYFQPKRVAWKRSVETEIYGTMEGDTQAVFLGIDIGSTSTKAMLIDQHGEPLLGLYTRTSGRPLYAVQALFEAVSSVEEKHHTTFRVMGLATTGSGRKFIGTILGSDLVLDEISAHAIAAYRLEPEIDTIIEIGGQDSKFTRLQDGVVTFSQMNNVCAAGTGSFIEEQAERLGVPVDEVSTLVEGASSPLASDRCTVFMERDINHFMSEGYSVGEILSAVLHSIRENYLTKVASQTIGSRVCFQGATARNRSLVAAFEQKLQRPIIVSRYCHLTGALGAALEVMRESPGHTRFKGIYIYRSPIPVRTERCSLCGNHCRLRIARVDGKEEAFGFLCGRDYTTSHYVPRKKAENFLDRRKTYFDEPESGGPGNTGDTLAIPGGLHLFSEAPLWKHFFSSLGLNALFIHDDDDPVAAGKSLTGAEFCAPMTAFHAHIRKAADISDILFLPVYLDIRAADPFPGRACYYTQFSIPVVMASMECLEGVKTVSPVLSFRKDEKELAKRLYEALKEVYGRRFTPEQVLFAFHAALEHFEQRRQRMIRETEEEVSRLCNSHTFAVVLTGRPYTVLDDSMNKGIPAFIASQSVPVLYHDMADLDAPFTEFYGDLIDTFHWQHARDILRTAALCAGEEHLYPVLLTSFKCSPDSFVIEYFKRILDGAGKPYLILQLDEHDSRVGYETRIEAALRSFRNHFNTGDKASRVNTLPVKPEIETSIEGKTLLFPNWDPLCIPLVAANLVHAGYDARVLRENQSMIAESMRLNTGQCIPVNVIAHEYADYIRSEGLDPGNTVLWMARSQWACNIPVYPYYIKSLLEAEGEGLENAGVYIGELTHIELSPLITVRAYFAYMFGGILRKIGCSLRPYEKIPGAVDRVIERSHRLFLDAFRGDITFISASKQTAGLFRGIDTSEGRKPLVALFGDIYVRDNPVMNQDLIHRIEAAGGEALVTPYNDYVKIVAGAYFNRWKLEGRHSDILVFKTLLAAMRILERFYTRYFRPLVSKPFSPDYARMGEELREYAVDVQHEGESFENILKIAHILEEHPEVSLFVQTNPAFCCPSIVTEAMKTRIEEITGVPVVTITYDGTGADKNDVVVPYIRYGCS